MQYSAPCPLQDLTHLPLYKRGKTRQEKNPLKSLKKLTCMLKGVLNSFIRTFFPSVFVRAVKISHRSSAANITTTQHFRIAVRESFFQDFCYTDA